jgi:hypothetical protein
MVRLGWIYGVLFALMYLLARVRRALTRRDRLAAEPFGSRKTA